MARNGHAEATVSLMLGKRNRDQASDQAFCGGADDENRTRTIGLGICRVQLNVSGFHPVLARGWNAARCLGLAVRAGRGDNSQGGGQ
jgi:hypothetical protein